MTFSTDSERTPQFDRRNEFGGPEDQARRQHRGLWADNAPVAAWEWWKTEKERKAAGKAVGVGRWRWSGVAHRGAALPPPHCSAWPLRRFARMTLPPCQTRHRMLDLATRTGFSRLFQQELKPANGGGRTGGSPKKACLEGKRMVSGHTGNVVPGNRLWVRIPCPPL